MVFYNLVKSLLFMIFFLTFTSLYFFHVFYRETQTQTRSFKFLQKYYNEVNKDFLVYTPGCKIRKYDPFDYTVKKFYVEVPYAYDCDAKKPLFRVKENGEVSLDEEQLYKQHEVYKNETDCFFYPITRSSSAEKPDNTFILGKKHDMIFDLPIEDDFILLKCKSANKTIASSVLALTPLKQEVEERCEYSLKSNKIDVNLSVIIVGIDSVSKLNFIRYFPNTLNLLRNELSTIELNGFTKVADNTYPNLISFLTGRHRNHYKVKEKRYSFYDDTDFVWKQYSKLGYRTLFSEDAPDMGTFVLNRRGFLNPPTDYYSRPFSVAVESLSMRKKTHCIGPVLEMQVYFEYLLNFLNTMGKKPVFTFSFMARLTHDIFKNAGYADKPSYELIKALRDAKVLNRSLLVFFSDHGIRFGDIRQAYVGKIEERMPFVFLTFPEWFLKKYSTFSKNLAINKNRLTTPYDIHATLLHLLNTESETFHTSNGQSLFTEIPAGRTCADAAIAKHWCVCQSHVEVSTEDINVQRAALAIIKEVNAMLRPYFKACVPLKMEKILDARISQLGEDSLETAERDYLITLLAVPSGAIFEATVLVRKNEFKVSEEISRLNRYGTQSDCIQHPVLRKYCCCRRNPHS